MKEQDGELVPDLDEEKGKEGYKKLVTVTVPDSLDHPNHFGYVIWKACQLIQQASTVNAAESG